MAGNGIVVARKLAVAALNAILGAAIGMVLLWTSVALLTRLFFGPLPATGRLVDGLHTAISFGFMMGAVAGLERASRGAAVWQKRVIQGLCAWIVGTVFILSSVALLVLPFQVALGLAQSPKLPVPIWAYVVAQIVPVWLASGWLLNSIFPAIRTRRKPILWQNFRAAARTAIRAVVWPRAEDLLHDFRIEVPLSPAEIRVRYDAKPTIFEGPLRIKRILNNETAARIVWRGDTVILTTKPDAQFAFYGQIRSVEAGSLLTGRVQMPKLLRLHSAMWFGGLLLLSFVMLVSIMAQFATPKPLSNGIVMAAFICLMQLFGLVMHRAYLVVARRHERALEQFFRVELQASQCDLTRRFDFWPWF